MVDTLVLGTSAERREGEKCQLALCKRTFQIWSYAPSKKVLGSRDVTKSFQYYP